MAKLGSGKMNTAMKQFSNKMEAQQKAQSIKKAEDHFKATTKGTASKGLKKGLKLAEGGVVNTQEAMIKQRLSKARAEAQAQMQAQAKAEKQRAMTQRANAYRAGQKPIQPKTLKTVRDMYEAQMKNTPQQKQNPVKLQPPTKLPSQKTSMGRMRTTQMSKGGMSKKK